MNSLIKEVGVTWILPAILFWSLLKKITKLWLPGYQKLFYGTAISFLHSNYMTLASTYMLLYDCAVNRLMTPIHSISIAYFIYDLSNTWDDKIFIVHHLSE